MMKFDLEVKLLWQESPAFAAACGPGVTLDALIACQLGALHKASSLLSPDGDT